MGDAFAALTKRIRNVNEIKWKLWLKLYFFSLNRVKTKKEKDLYYNLALYSAGTGRICSC